jgi:hypothetical protein
MRGKEKGIQLRKGVGKGVECELMPKVQCMDGRVMIGLERGHLGFFTRRGPPST